MTIGIVGLGLIGGSMAKAIKEYTNHTVLGFDKSEAITKDALKDGAADDVLNKENIFSCDLIIIALYPAATIEFIKEHAPFFKKGITVMDCGGTKTEVCTNVEAISEKYGFNFVGAHPMAGIEKSGYYFSIPNMFKNASLILVPYSWTPKSSIELIENLAAEIGFTNIQFSTPSRHDEMISYTSQLAHVVSCAYVMSPLADNFEGFSAGSFRDMTRVAKLNEVMWTQLFIENKDYLCNQIDTLIDRLHEMSDAIKTENKAELQNILRLSRETKERIEHERQ